MAGTKQSTVGPVVLLLENLQWIKSRYSKKEKPHTLRVGFGGERLVTSTRPTN